MEKIQLFWGKISKSQKEDVINLLYYDYDFSKKRIDRKIVKNIKLIHKYLDKINADEK